MEIIIGFILVLVFLSGGFLWIKKIFNSNLDAKVITQECRERVEINSQRRVAGIQTIKVNCPTKYITFHMDRADQEYESSPFSAENEPLALLPITYNSRDSSCATEKEVGKMTDEQEKCMFKNINRIIADEMAECWFKFYKGGMRVFSAYDENRQCIVCSVLFFDSSMQQKYSEKGLIGFTYSDDESYSLDAYMKKNNNLQYTGNDNYYEYTLDHVKKNFDLPYYDYSVNQEYAVVFSALNKNAVDLIKSNQWDVIRQEVSDYEPDEEEEGNFINTIDFIPNEQVGTICDEWA